MTTNDTGPRVPTVSVAPVPSGAHAVILRRADAPPAVVNAYDTPSEAAGHAAQFRGALADAYHAGIMAGQAARATIDRHETNATAHVVDENNDGTRWCRHCATDVSEDERHDRPDEYTPDDMTYAVRLTNATADQRDPGCGHTTDACPMCDGTEHAPGERCPSWWSGSKDETNRDMEQTNATAGDPFDPAPS